MIRLDLPDGFKIRDDKQYIYDCLLCLGSFKDNGGVAISNKQGAAVCFMCCLEGVQKRIQSVTEETNREPK